MVKATLQKRVAADILKVGRSRVWIDSAHLKDVEGVITRADIRKAISKGHIAVRPEKIKMPATRKKAKKGPGKRKGTINTRYPKKRQWINTVRPLRRMLKSLKDAGKIDTRTYRKIYLQIKAGAFRTRSHLKLFLKQRGIGYEEKNKT